MRADGVDVTLDCQQDAVYKFLAQTIIPIPSRAAKDRVLKNITSWINDITKNTLSTAV